MQAVVNGRVVLPREVLPSGTLLFDREICAVGKSGSVDISGADQVYDAQGAWVFPGMIDIHIHGALGWDVMDGDPRGIQAMSSFLASRGVTSFCPTTMSMPLPAVDRAVEAVNFCRREKLPGADILGVHLEGPFLSEKYRGAQNIKNILEPQKEWVLERKNSFALVTYAPEKDPRGDFCSSLTAAGLRLSVGHTGASYEEVLRACDDGAVSATHLFNGMPPVHHRNPGVVGAVLGSSLYAEIIADGVHVHPAFFGLVLAMKGPEKVILISDAMRAAGLGEGSYDLGGQEVRLSHGEARLRDGTLAGSVLTLDRAFRNVFYGAGVSLPHMARLSSANAADLLGCTDRGRLAPGKRADMVFFDSHFQVLRTVVGGKTVFVREREDGKDEAL